MSELEDFREFFDVRPDIYFKVYRSDRRGIVYTTEDTVRWGAGRIPEFEILIDDISTDIATVRVVSAEYLDYLHVAKTSEGWKIVNVLFRIRE